MTSKEILKKFGIHCKNDEKRNCSHMTSKEAFEKIIELCNHYQHTIVKDTEIGTIWGYPIDNIRKDLEILECFQKIDKKELKDFIETQIRYTLNENTWLSACNCDLEKEKPTKHLIKIKEWLEDE